MPLHLLGKKSWNVYNQDSISRVRRDEAEAQAREEAAEQRMQEEDAQRRIAILRGEEVEPLPSPEEEHEQKGRTEDRWREKRKDDTYAQRDLKRKRRRGEDDTDRDIRYAKQDNPSFDSDKRATRELLGKKEKDAPLEDHAGHVQLFVPPDEVALRKAEKNAEVEAEKARKKRKEEDQVTMRFSNAAGYGQGSANGIAKPWYATAAKDSKNSALSSTAMVLAGVQEKDVWGNEDPRRKEREQNRISTGDPFAFMQQAQRQLKQSEKDREHWERKQRGKMEKMRQDERRERKEMRRHREDDQDSLDGFSLDAPTKSDRGAHEKHRDRRHHHHRRRHHSRSRSRDRDRDHRHIDRQRGKER